MLSFFKFLTFIFVLTTSSLGVDASVLNQENLKSHLRWEIKSYKEQIKISKSASTVRIESLDPEFFEVFSADVAKLSINNGYHQKYTFTKPTSAGLPYVLELDLKDSSVELFSFYKADLKKYVLDFWINEDLALSKPAPEPRVIKVAKLKTEKKILKAQKKVDLNKALRSPSKKVFNVINPEKIQAKSKDNEYRDFRYGAAFVWDYEPIIPTLRQDLNLKVKAPDFLYEVEDRKFLDDKKQAHMQLIINFYRKEKWGLMTKSISLYEQKYGMDSNKLTNDFMKSVSMIKNTIKKSENIGNNDDNFSRKGILAAARTMLVSIAEGSEDYSMNKAILRYLVQYSRNENDHINSLGHAKNLYVAASEAHDDDMLRYSSEVILNSLAHLKQLDKIKSFLETKAVKRLLPKQEGLAYISFVHLHRDNTAQVVKDFIKEQSSLVSPIHPALLYNTAEAYFRTAEYEKAIKLYDEFLSQYSFLNENSHTRLRIALSYDLLGREPARVLRLYKDAINKSSLLNIRFEAKVRYVGLNVARKFKPTREEIETIAFLDATASEKSQINKENKKNLWLIRLRSFIATKNYKDALAYLASLPLESLRQVESRAFVADGAEIVLGIIQKAYLDEDYAGAVKAWEVYKEKYETKVAKNPYMNFIVSDSFLKLGLLESYERSVSTLKAIKKARVRAYPRWIDIQKDMTIEDYTVELTMNSYVRSKDYEALEKYMGSHKKNENINYNFYNAIVANHKKNYNETVASVEKNLTTPNANNLLTPSQSQEMLQVYLESLYESAEPRKFRQKVAALISDFRRGNSNRFSTLVERADYLYLESLFSETTIDYKLMSRKTKEFLAGAKDSPYAKRIQYLRAISLINIEESSSGKKILEELINNKDVPEYLKGLARSELSTLILKNKTL